MKGAAAVAEILKREGVQFLIGYPVNTVIEASAQADIRTIIVRQERTGHPHGGRGEPGHLRRPDRRVRDAARARACENSFGGVAQAYGDSVPIVVIPGGYPRRLTNVPPNFNAFLNYQHVTKSAEQVIMADAIPDAMRRAFTQVRNGRPRPVLVEIPVDLMTEEVPEPLDYVPALRTRVGPDPVAVSEVARVLVAAERPVIYAGQGVHYAKAWEGLRALAELLECPVTTSLEGKSAFPENHALSLGSGGRSVPKAVRQFLDEADVIFGIGCSFSHDELRREDAEGEADHPLDARPRGPLEGRAGGPRADRRRGSRARRAARGDQGPAPRQAARAVGRPWPSASARRSPRGSRQWMPRLTQATKPLSPYRVIWDLLHTVDVSRTIITHDAGSPRDQLSPFWECTTPAVLHRLGEDDPARLRPRARDGREAGPSRTGCASTSGATPPSASPGWTSRPRCASGSRSCRSC